ncbi:replication protein (plasmid) [Acidihalobacter aeolianus]|uniref:Replication protein n=1 Tax=Acidihalobacter aeolianus TaxID=2792603 RepID=A0A1D8KD09_9GAMM|nr:replication protein [Acidihalobacter aeolianus]
MSIITKHLEIHETPPTSEDIAFLSTVMCQVGLPRSEVVEREFFRRSGDAWLMVQAGAIDEGGGPVMQPLPYGPIPRLAIAWLSTYALRNDTREIPVGRSAAEFLRNIGSDDGDTRRHHMLAKQLKSLTACRIQMGFRGITHNPAPMISSLVTFTKGKRGKQRIVWPGVLYMSEEYFKTLQNGATPLDRRAMSALRGSSLCLDIYCFLANRLHRISGKPIVLHWKTLHEQFGQEYGGSSGIKNFKRKFKVAIKSVLAVYPQAKAKIIEGGLQIGSSPPPIAYRTKSIKSK